MTDQTQLNYTKIEFLKSAPKLSHCPPDEGAEVAFAGRSNAGKSSAINSLTGNHKLARTSKTPGRTQLINFFELDPDHRLVDLPGYGFAKVPTAMKKEWQKNLNEYLQERNCLKGLVLLVDIRHPLKEFDEMMIEWAGDSKMPLHIMLTKSDKLKKGPAQAALLKLRREMTNKWGDLITVQTFSALKHEGVKEVHKKLNEWLLGDQ